MPFWTKKEKRNNNKSASRKPKTHDSATFDDSLSDDHHPPSSHRSRRSSARSSKHQQHYRNTRTAAPPLVFLAIGVTLFVARNHSALLHRLENAVLPAHPKNPSAEQQHKLHHPQSQDPAQIQHHTPLLSHPNASTQILDTHPSGPVPPPASTTNATLIGVEAPMAQDIARNTSTDQRADQYAHANVTAATSHNSQNATVVGPLSSATAHRLPILPPDSYTLTHPLHTGQTHKTNQSTRHNTDGNSAHDTRRRSIVLDSVSKDYSRVIEQFFQGIPQAAFSRGNIDKYRRNPEVAEVSIHVVFAGGNATLNYNGEPLQASIGPDQPRLRSLQVMMQRLETEFMVPDCEFLVQLNDGFKPKTVMFGSARHWQTWQCLIPVPMGNERGLRTGTGTSFSGWDTYMHTEFLRSHAMYPWHLKKPKAVFRGNFAMQTNVLGSCNKGGICKSASQYSQVNRGVLLNVAKTAPSLVDVSFVSASEGSDVPVVPGARLSLRDHQTFKYILNVGSNQDWAERLRLLLLLNSAVIKHEAETQEFFYPLLEPFKHYIPTNLMMDDLVSQVEWAVAHDQQARDIARAANEFATTYLTLGRMTEYWFICLTKYAEIQTGYT